ncbi:uncharacterized protein LY89DRAFT_668359 [Mollisia scopiformis]|uniref:Uncharacterized protein n=1 Tax=Mollisia scopiformis TaxID=149040 RepID=A0A194XDE9_MOLSC|nr:uncharacterized protein LY89DRAFT_668359 [Mollisia scopiformis]KUJ18176.1 hypothetical protein LY89DRAFT_668359 [Mollisia scopiformis]
MGGNSAIHQSICLNLGESVGRRLCNSSRLRCWKKYSNLLRLPLKPFWGDQRLLHSLLRTRSPKFERPQTTTRKASYQIVRQQRSSGETCHGLRVDFVFFVVAVKRNPFMMPIINFTHALALMVHPQIRWQQPSDETRVPERGRRSERKVRSPCVALRCMKMKMSLSLTRRLLKPEPCPFTPHEAPNVSQDEITITDHLQESFSAPVTGHGENFRFPIAGTGFQEQVEVDLQTPTDPRAANVTAGMRSQIPTVMVEEDLQMKKCRRRWIVSQSPNALLVISSRCRPIRFGKVQRPRGLPDNIEIWSRERTSELLRSGFLGF